jgi:hypothetical protein
MKSIFNWRFTFFILPIIIITLCFLNDGGISVGLNFLYYWFCIIGFLLFYEITMLLIIFYKEPRKIDNKKDIKSAQIGLFFLIASIFYFMINFH